jgi:hypothetical protein
LSEQGEQLVNDHVAFRTFDLKGINRLELGGLFESWGYTRVAEDLDFPEKKLKTSYYLHSDPKLPKSADKIFESTFETTPSHRVG